MTRTDETWYRLLNWTYGLAAARQLAAQVLLDQGFTLLGPDHLLGGPDGGTDTLYVKDGQRWLMMLYFQQEQQSFDQIKTQFQNELASVAKIPANGIVFITNQELSRSERGELKQVCDFSLLDVFDLDRVATILDSPRMAQVRQQTLYVETIPANPISDSNESTATLAQIRQDVINFDRLARKDFAAHGADWARSLNNLSVKLHEQGERDASLAANQRVVAIYENLAQQNFAAHGKGLAASLHNSALFSQRLNNHATAVELGKRAVAIYESLAQQDFATYSPSLALCLHNLASSFESQGEHKLGLAALQRAIQIRETLARAYPAQHEADLAASLFDLSRFTIGPDAAPILARAINLIEPYAKPGTTSEARYKQMSANWRKRIQGNTNLMQLNKLSLRNYRGFKQIEIDFEPDITVLVANNGQGKTTILDACRIAIWPHLSGFDLAHTEQVAQLTIQVDDIHFHKMSAGNWEHQVPATIEVSGNYGEYSDTAWAQSLDSTAPGSQTRDNEGTTSLKAWTKLLQSQVRDPQQPPLDLPVFAYYDTDRSWSQQRAHISLDPAKHADTGSDFYVRTFAYRDCLKSAPSYNTFEEWFESIFISHRETQITNKEAGLAEDAPSIWSDSIRVVQQAVDSLLKKHTGWHSLEYSVSHEKSLILRNDQNLTLKVSQLSDGIRNILGMVGDLAFRCVKINPHLGSRAALEAHGVVLIDEIDMHLHPGWQQQVVSQLCEAFPKIQFIVTTHSQQVLSSVFARSIRQLPQQAKMHADHFEIEPVQYETRGVASSDILARIMKIDEVPDVPQSRELNQYRALIQQNLHETEAGQALAERLNQHFGERHPEMLECTRMIKLEDVKRKVEAARAEKAAKAAGVGHA
jgi:predicted ATP-binding protein involved in virulence